MMWMNTLGFLLIAFVVWWFFFAKNKITRSDHHGIDIKVENGVYTPARVEIPKNETVTLRFSRADGSPCAATVVFDGLDIEEELPLGQVKTINVTPSQPGSYAFHCQMNMYKGELVVV